MIALDTSARVLATRLLIPEVPLPLLGNVVRLRLLFNPGFMLGIGGAVPAWSVIAAPGLALIVLGIAVFGSSRDPSPALVCGGACVAGGGLSIIFTRLVTAGSAVSYIDVGIGRHRWPNFSLADAAVVIGTALVAWDMYRRDQVTTATASVASHPPCPSREP